MKLFKQAAISTICKRGQIFRRRTLRRGMVRRKKKC